MLSASPVHHSSDLRLGVAGVSPWCVWFSFTIEMLSRSSRPFSGNFCVFILGRKQNIKHDEVNES